ncbi:MAG: aminotransferase class IV [Alphaproteobacteria bacterium]|nr:aminotransferase class IV [Alphaproteobacteria bacterium]
MYYVNGQLTDQKPTIAVADFGFARGITVFELFRVYGGVPFRLAEHLARLAFGAKELGIALPYTLAEIETQCRNLMAQHRYAHSAVKLYLTAGVPQMSSGLSFAACADFTPQLFIMEDEVKPKHPEAPYGYEAYARGQALKTVAHIRELPQVKTANYGIGYYAARQVAGSAYDDVLFTTPQGYVTEATRSNVFFIMPGGKLVTPKSGMLYGITRQVVLELVQDLGIECQEADLTPTDIYQAEAAFTTGSIAELVPARSLDDHALPFPGFSHPVFQQLRAAFGLATGQGVRAAA